jgi:hypothetical protein
MPAGDKLSAQYAPPDARLCSFVTQTAGVAPVGWEPVGNRRGSGATWRVELAGGRFLLLKIAPEGVADWQEPALQQALARLGAPVLPVVAVSADRRAMIMPWVSWPTCADILTAVEQADTRALVGRLGRALRRTEALCRKAQQHLRSWLAPSDEATGQVRSVAAGLRAFIAARLVREGLAPDAGAWDALEAAATAGPVRPGPADYHAGNVLINPDGEAAGNPYCLSAVPGPWPPQSSEPSPGAGAYEVGALLLDWPCLSLDYTERRLVQYCSLPPYRTAVTAATVAAWEREHRGDGSRLAAHYRLYWGLVVARLWAALVSPDSLAAAAVRSTWAAPAGGRGEEAIQTAAERSEVGILKRALAQAIALWVAPLAEPVADRLAADVAPAFSGLLPGLSHPPG